MTLLEKIDNLVRRANAHFRRLNVLDHEDNAPLVLKGVLSQSSTDDPVLTILHNTLGEVPTMGRTSAGLYTMTMVGDVFTENKTFWYGFAPQDATDDKALGVVRTSAKVLTISQSVATVATDAFAATPIVIEVHP